MRRPRPESVALVPGVLALAFGACATTSKSTTPASPTPPVTTYEMEPVKITAVNGPEGPRLESFDATELFEQAGAALSEKRYDDAVRTYDRLLKEFDDPRYKKAAIYNAGLALQGKKEWSAAIDRFRTLVAQYPDTGDAKDALFQIGASYAEMENWPTSATMFAEILERKDLSADDRIEAMGRRGFAQFKLRDLDAAERTFRNALAYFTQIEKDERLQTDFYLGLCKYHLGQIPHERFRSAPLRLPEKQMSVDMEEKARLLLFAQRQYIEAIKLGNPQWASASGYQVGSLYEEFYDAFIHAPIPPELVGPSVAQAERREIYFDELRKKIRILLEKSVRVHEQNLLMLERLGVDNEWRDKSKLAYAKLQRLLDPSARLAPGEEGPDVPPPAPPPAAPAPPVSRPPASVPGGDPPSMREQNRPPAEPPFQRQIL